MKILVNPNKLYIEVRDSERQIKTYACISLLHFETVKRTLVALKRKQSFDNSLLKEIQTVD